MASQTGAAASWQRRGPDSGINVPERALAAAVILQAIADSQARCDPRGGITQAEIAQAWKFLTARVGGWAEMRSAWCGYAGLDPREVRQRALAGQLKVVA